MTTGCAGQHESVEVFTLKDRDRWQRAHALGGLPSQSWVHARAMGGTGITPMLGIVTTQNARMLIPFFEREWEGTRDIATLLGLSGASVQGASAEIPQLLSLWRAHALSRGWICGYLQLAVPLPATECFGSELACNGNPMYLLDLDVDRIWKNASAIMRRKVRRTDRDGFVLVRDRDRLADSLLALYHQSHWRQSASTTYDFSDEALLTWMMDPSTVVVGAVADGDVHAVSLFLAAGSRAEYHINVNTEFGRSTATWLIWKGIQELAAQGVGVLNLGGGIARGDGLAKFKGKFGGRCEEVHSLRQIYDQTAYAALTGHASGGDTGRFPSYRFGST